jgi:alkylation response protein AidB-like acyl-CoA dehydrogenase
VDFDFTEEQQMLRESVRKLMTRTATPDYVRRLDREQSYPHELYAAWVDAGFFAMPFPEDYGGLGGTIVDAAIIAEEIGRVSGDFAMAYTGGIFCALNILRKGSEEQKRRWIPDLIGGKVKFGIGISEADAGSDIAAMRTSARLDGDHWIINGRKLWQTGAGVPGVVIHLYVRTEPKASHRDALSLILVPNDAPGITARKLSMLGCYCTGTYEVEFDDVRVPAKNLVGAVNQGWECLLSGLQAERAVVAAADCGSAAAVVEMTLDYSKQRRQFGRAIGEFQAIAHRIADMQISVEAARAMMWRAVWLASRGRDAVTEISMAKLLAAETYVRVASEAMQIHGGMGYSMEYDLQRYFRDSRVRTIAAGSSEVLRNLIASKSGLKFR